VRADSGGGEKGGMSSAYDSRAIGRAVPQAPRRLDLYAAFPNATKIFRHRLALIRGR